MATERRRIDLAVINRLFEYAMADPVIDRCRRHLAQAAIEMNDFEVRVVGKGSKDQNGVAIPYLNSNDFQRALVRTWNEASTYLRLIGLVVIAVPKDRTKWLQRLAENTDLQLAEQLQLPWRVVRLTPQAGALTEIVLPRGQGTYFEYEPRRDSERTLFTYYIYRDAAWAFAEALPVRDMHRDLVDTETLMLLEGAGTTLGTARSARYTLRSPYFALLQSALELGEVKQNVLDAEFAMAHPIHIFTKRPTKDIMPSLVGSEAIERGGSVHAGGVLQQQQMMQLAFEFALDYFTRNLLPPGTHRDKDTGEAVSKADAMRREYHRPHPNDDALFLPEDVEAVSRAAPTYAVDMDACFARHLRSVAMVFDLPISYVEASFIGQAQKSDAVQSSTSRLSAAENTGIDEQAQKEFHTERLRFSRFLRWLYARTYAGFELLAMNEWLDRIGEDVQLGSSRLTRDTGFAGTKSQRRAQLAALLTGKGTASASKKRKRRNEDEPTDDDGEGMTTAELRLLIAERLQAEEYLEATVYFDVDAASKEDLLRAEETLPEHVIKYRLELSKQLVEASKAGGASAASIRQAFSELHGIDLEEPSKEELQRHVPLPEPKAPPAKKAKH
jgi:hypothetical protein